MTTLTLPLWVIPFFLTLIICAITFLRPLPTRHGDYDFGPSLIGFFRFVTSVVAMLVIWLAYFMAKSFGWLG